MTYAGFLAGFVGVPLAILAMLTLRDRAQGKRLPKALSGFSPVLAIGLHVLVAVLYTTPWDNYLVATRVWYYDPARVIGVVLGWVPVEEYTFFVVQTLFVGLWLIFLAHRLNIPVTRSARRFLPLPLFACAVVWLAAVAMLARNWRPGAYLGLELAWFLPPVMLQLAYGASILWHYRCLILATALPAWLYLSISDGLAIAAGVWTVNPIAATGIHFFALPLEEFVFFGLTTTLIVFGLTLLLAQETWDSWPFTSHAISQRRVGL